MKVEMSELDDDLRLIRLGGRLDNIGTREIERAFSRYCAVDNGRVLVDLSAVEFLTSYGIRFLVQSAKNVAGRGGRMFLLSPNAHVLNVLEVSGVRSVIPVYESLDAARAAFLTA